MLSAEGELDKALEYFTKDLRITIDVLGRTHMDVALSLASLGQLHGRRRDFAASLASFQDALRTAVAAMGEDHPMVEQIKGDIRLTEKMASQGS